MSLSNASFEYIQRFLLHRTSIVLEENKAYLVQARLLPVAKQHGMDTVEQLVAALQRPHNGVLIDDVIDAMTTNETFFFRDAAPFAALQHEVFPQLFARRAATRRLTVWSAACSTGQEPYSVAIMLREHFSEYRDWNIQVLGTDLSRTALDQAQRGRYNDLEVNRGLSAELRDKYFRREGTDWVIVNQVRSMVQFRRLNLAVQWPALPRMDIVLLRNVMVYFSNATKKLILNRVRNQMWSDGYLFLGGAETTLHLDNAFRRITFKDFSFFQLHEESG